jgi:hypothetical protein
MILGQAKTYRDLGWDAHCPTCGILVPDLERVRAENEALKKQLAEKRLKVARTDD